MFSSGTQHTLLGKPKLITLADAICNLAPRHLGCTDDAGFDQNYKYHLIV